ncbi:MAG TPA: energy transducer TonB [Candidatus Baltobacteraceae bacterium]
MNPNACPSAEVLAGAIALGEATDAQRESYRLHLSGCEACVRALGGERGIERTMATFRDARDGETWSPELTRSIRDRMNPRGRAIRWGAGALAACVALSLAIHVAAVGGIARYAATSTLPVDRFSRVEHVSLDSAQPVQAIAAAPARRRLVVVHNVVTLAQPQRERSPKAPPVAAGSGVTVSPIGGEDAINPIPAPIAYVEDAQGTTAFEVFVDQRGVPIKCTITKTSSYEVLDSAVCKAAMAAHYTPRTIGSRAFPGTYSDAFTFRQ